MHELIKTIKKPIFTGLYTDSLQSINGKGKFTINGVVNGYNEIQVYGPKPYCDRILLVVKKHFNNFSLLHWVGQGQFSVDINVKELTMETYLNSIEKLVNDLEKI